MYEPFSVQHDFSFLSLCFFQFLNFFLDEKNLVTWMKDEWNKLYESSYVQTNLLSPILR